MVDCHISDIKRVNRAVRILFGAFPGRAWVEIKVILRNQKEGTIDGEAVIEGGLVGRNYLRRNHGPCDRQRCADNL